MTLHDVLEHASGAGNPPIRAPIRPFQNHPLSSLHRGRIKRPLSRTAASVRGYHWLKRVVLRRRQGSIGTGLEPSRSLRWSLGFLESGVSDTPLVRSPRRRQWRCLERASAAHRDARLLDTQPGAHARTGRTPRLVLWAEWHQLRGVRGASRTSGRRLSASPQGVVLATEGSDLYSRSLVPAEVVVEAPAPTRGSRGRCGALPRLQWRGSAAARPGLW